MVHLLHRLYGVDAPGYYVNLESSVSGLTGERFFFGGGGYIPAVVFKMFITFDDGEECSVIVTVLTYMQGFF